MLTRSVLDNTPPITQLLQSKSIDKCDGLLLIESLKALVITTKQKEKISIPETVPRVAGTLIHSSNNPAESVSDYYKRKIIIPQSDHLLSELYYKFDSSKITANFDGFVTEPAKLIAIVPYKVSNFQGLKMLRLL